MADAFRDLVADPLLLRVYDHWCRVRGGNRMPALSDIDAAELGTALPHIWVLRLDSDGELRGRLAGEFINTVLGMNVRDKRISDVFPPAVVPRLVARYRRVMGEPSCCHMTGRIFAADGVGGMGERIVLPIGEDRHNGDGVIGVTVYDRIRVIRNDRLSFGPIEAVFVPIS